MSSAKSHDSEEILRWLRDYLRLKPSTKLTLETRINLDLGVDGGDGEELMRDFGERFSVDVSSFPYDRYFGPEAGASPLALLSMAWRLVTRQKLRSVDPLLVSDLVAMVPKK